jgi:hypothetical protein
MLRLNLHRFLRDTPIVLHLVEIYPTEFLVLQPNSQSNGYPLILVRTSLAKTYAYIGCREGNMTITDNLS